MGWECALKCSEMWSNAMECAQWNSFGKCSGMPQKWSGMCSEMQWNVLKNGVK